jgi:hypothetical protein
LLKNTPQFSIFKDNYFITDLLERTQAVNSDAKLQISTKERITKRIITPDTLIFYLYQKLFGMFIVIRVRFLGF